MGIRKQDFYEGAAIHLLARSGRLHGVSYKAPFFVFNREVAVLLKYSTRVRSPWAFTFMPDEQLCLERKSAELRTVVALICGADGVAAVSYADFRAVGAPRQSAFHVSCYRQHGEWYELNGPDGTVASKIAPANWRRLLEV